MESRWLWPFELTEKLGEGGMGTVFRARYLGNNRQVAVKLLPNEVASNPVLLGRFERELEVLKQMRHPNIVRCFGGTCESEQRFYAMELVDGGTLGDLLLQKPLSWEMAVDYGLQMCEALQYAHERGVIHRDVKPGNFLLTKSGQIKLSDFGLAAIATANRLTAAGKTVGTIQYMSPEQIRGKPALTCRADLYSLGCVLFEMITGDPPYNGDNAAAVLQSHLTDEIPHAASFVLDCPLKLDQLIFELMSKESEQRPASAAEVGWRLEEILQPGKRVTAEPQLFSPPTARTVAVPPLQNIGPSSDFDVSIPRPASSPWMPIVAGVLLLTTIVCWLGWSRSAEQILRAEQALAKMVADPDPNKRASAVQALNDLGPLHSQTIEKLRAATREKVPGIRAAALTVLTNHAAESRSLQTEFLRIEKTDEDPSVRYQAGLAVEAINKAPSSYLLSRLASVGVVILMIAGVGCGWALWRRLKPFVG